jgi:hypothetical protein
MLRIHLFALPDWFNHLVALIVFVLAMWRGDSSARAIASIVLAASVANHLFFKAAQATAWSHPVALWANLVGDIAILAVCLGCARRTQAYWVIWASSVALVAVVTDLSGALFSGVTLWAYGSAVLVWFHALNGVVLWGALSRPRPQPA